MSTGYSGTSLPRKLGLKDGQIVGFIERPEYLAELDKAAACVRVDHVARAEQLRDGYDVVHMYSKSRTVISEALPILQDKILANGMIWISWTKTASKVATDATENVVRAAALRLKLVDFKVCAVDAVWSGLKLVIRKELRG
ncbi:MAG: DUF3052 domain-containing protein [Pseudomonadota bacterium]